MNLETLIRGRAARGATKSELTCLTAARDQITALTARVNELLEERDAHTCPRCAVAHRLAVEADDPTSTKTNTRAALDKLRAHCKGRN